MRKPVHGNAGSALYKLKGEDGMTTTSSGIDYDSLVQDARVHGSLYYDPAIFQEELDKIWYRTWVYVGHASEIPQPGDYRTRFLGLQPVIMSRDEDGQVHLLLNRCAHRGNTVCQYERGNAHAFRCAYHGWTFANDGSLLGVTYASAYGPEFDKGAYGLTAVPRVAVYRGFIFGSMSAEGPSLEEHLGAAKERIDRWCDLSPSGEIDVRAGVQKMRIRANWKMPLENSVDNYHANFIHASAFNTRELKGRMGFMTSDKSLGVERDLGNGHTEIDFTPQDRASSRTHQAGGILSMLSEQARGDYVNAMERKFGAEAQQRIADGPPHIMIYPNLFLINYDIRVIQPVSVNLTHYYHYMVFLKNVPAELNTLRLRGHERAYGPAGAILPDDVDTFERNQLSLEARVNEWVQLRRGSHRERTEPNGIRLAHIADELTQRGQWRHYKRVMAQP
jgi:phenylpropionate dioxygenase-like ring-hydroxylating dioxygenase large terminal subunit